MTLSREDLEQHYKLVFKQYQQILEMDAYNMVCHLQQQFNHLENSTPFENKEALEKNFMLLESENKEMRAGGLNRHDMIEFRDGIADQITVALFLAFKVDGIQFEPFQHISPLIPKTYAEYCDQVDSALADLKEAMFSKNSKDQSQDRLNHFLARLYTLPEFSKIDIMTDLTDITFSSLSKLCSTLEIAEQTLAAYHERGYKAHIEKVPSSYGIFVSDDCYIKGELIPKGKFLKSLYLIKPILKEIKEDTIWR